MTILIIDGSVQVVDRLESLVLEANNTLKIYKASTFHEALRLVDECNAEVALLDMNLPDNKSFDLLKKIREGGYNTYIIALSNHIPVIIQEHCKKLGAHFFLDKYSEFDKIPALINSIATNVIGHQKNNYSDEKPT